MSYPKWRHHPEKESVIVHDANEESYMAPDDQGWWDTRDYGNAPADPSVDITPDEGGAD
jgi:hypothetical protein